MAFIVVRPIDLAIFGTLGLLWIGGALFIYVLYRWIARYEREQDPQGPPLVPVETPAPAIMRERPPAQALPVTAREALAEG